MYLCLLIRLQALNLCLFAFGFGGFTTLFLILPAKFYSNFILTEVVEYHIIAIKNIGKIFKRKKKIPNFVSYLKNIMYLQKLVSK